ncbi:MAG: glutamate decarboxylase [Planctomycetes bacterium]|nr:glutamate decarboxylase [Planctomycetota bacterium]
MTSPRDALDALFTEAARLAVDTLAQNHDRDQPVVRRVPPRELIAALELELPAEGRGLEGVLDLARKTLHWSVRTGHPRFLNQLFGGYDPAGILGEWVAALGNTSMYTYEAAPVGTVVELALIERLNRYVGFDQGEGVFAPGGSISNLMCVLAARQRAFPHVKHEGLNADDRPVMFTSCESHYSLKRAGMVAGIGTGGTVEVPVDAQGRMRPDALERLVVAEARRGRTPFLVAATAGTTVAGAFDPIDALADVAGRHGLWLHVDASYGGSALLSVRHRDLLAGIDRADSVAWNPHKMMGVPLACSATLMRERGTLVGTMGMNADYLFHEDSDQDWDLGDRTLQCGRRVDALKLWYAWQVHGDQGYAERIEGLFDQARRFRALVEQRAGFRLVREPMGTNVCFRYLPRAERGATGEARDRAEGAATLRIRAALADSGRFLVNYATLDGAPTFRLVASNPLTGDEDLVALLDAIEDEA